MEMIDNPFTAIDIKKFEELFEGRKSAYGEYIECDTKKGAKVEGRARTVVAPITQDLYLAHLNGTKGLGIVPINEANMVRFVVIDVDIYDKDVTNRITKTIRKFNMPLCIFNSKSGGLHMYLFFQTLVPAHFGIESANKFKELLGLAKNTEVFPKQDKVDNDKVGNWINLPYFDARDNTSKRTLLNENGERVESVSVAIDMCTRASQTISSITEFFNTLPLSDAPPCLQRIHVQGNTDKRNDYLLSLAHYYKLKYGDQFESYLIDANSKLANPLAINELTSTVIASSKKRDYTYACSKEPLCSRCDRAECLKREYGIKGKTVSNLSFGEFRQILTDPPYYEWIVDDAVLRLENESDILYQDAFRKQCIRHLHVLPNKIKDEAWADIVNRALQNIVLVEMDLEEDTSQGAMVTKAIIEYVDKRSVATTINAIGRGIVFKDDSGYIFTPRGLIDYLTSIKKMKPAILIDLRGKLESLGGGQVDKIVKGVKTSCWVLPPTILNNVLTPEQEEKVNFLDSFGLGEI